MSLPPLPVDDTALDLYWGAIRGKGRRSSLTELLGLYSELAGSDTAAIEEVLRESWDGEPEVMVMRDPHYHPHDLIAALITEIRLLRTCCACGAED